jgi:hypothetical protein
MVFGLVAAAFAALNVWFTVLFYNIMCYTYHGYGGCPTVNKMIVTTGANGVVTLAFPWFFLFPALVFIIIVWLWLASELRRASATRLRLWTFSFPLIALVACAIFTLIASLISQGALIVYPISLWYGSWALVVWPLLVALVGWRARPATAPEVTTAPESQPAL